MNICKKLIYAALTGSAILSGASVKAEPQFTIRVADYLPPNHPTYEHGLKVFFEKIKDRLGDRVKFEYFPAEQLGKAQDLLNSLQSGVVGMAIVVPSYTAEKMPRVSVTELPGLYSTSCDGTKSVLKAIQDNGVLADDFRRNRIHPFMGFMYQPTDLLSSSRKIVEVADWQGYKARAPGGPTEIAIRELGGVPVKISVPDLYQAMSRGTVDGAMLVATSIPNYSLDSIVKSVTTGFSLGSVSTFYAVSDATWATLPPDVRAAIDAAGVEASMNLCESLDKLESDQLTKLAGRGVVINRLNDTQRASWNAVSGAAIKDWASRLRMQPDQVQGIYDALAKH